MKLFPSKKKTDDQTSTKQHSVFEMSMKRSLYLTGIVVALALGVLAYSLFRYMDRMSGYKSEQATYIPTPGSHKTEALFGGQQIPKVSTTSVFDMIEGYKKLSDENIDITERLHDYRMPFESFLRFLYLPSLNVWKDPFVGTIDTELMGRRFLEENPYTDIALINQWTDFFKSMGSDTYNEISSITVNEVVEEGPFFYIPIRVSFSAPNRRAFLFLLDKISLTSDKSNLMLVNEFFYHLREAILANDQLALGLQKVADDDELEMVVTGSNYDDLIAYSLMHWRDGDIDSLDFLDGDVMRDAVRRASGCRSTASQEMCDFQFREKFRSIPRLAYGLGYSQVSDNDLLYFLSDMPPILVLDDFTFQKTEADGIGGETTYDGEVSLRVYGQGISDAEVDEIARILGQECKLDNNQSMSVSLAQSLVQENLLQSTDSSIVGIQRSKDLLELQALLSDMASTYDGQTSYKKAIRLFETYRMLDDALFCKK